MRRSGPTTTELALLALSLLTLYQMHKARKAVEGVTSAPRAMADAVKAITG